MGEMKRVLLTGSTGFVGTHIYATLVEAGFEVLCGTRQPDEARKREPERTYVRFDLSDAASVDAALSNVTSAVYLVHSMADETEYAAAEKKSAETFRDIAAARGLERIVYLGGMRPLGKPSHHLESRLRTGETLRAGAVPVVELQATMIIGGGSESFRIVRDLGARLPFMLLPKWLESLSEPVAIRDVGAAIAYALAMPLAESEVFSVPGPEKLSGRDIILRTSGLLGHHPKAIGVPFVTPRLSSYWIRLVTRAHPNVATQLVEGLRSDIVSVGQQIWSRMPEYARTPFDVAVRTALDEEAATLRPSARLVERLLHRIAGGDAQPRPAR